jgi:hypothetical protein
MCEALDDSTPDVEPDTWWGAAGIDILIWADDPPYAEPAGDESTPAVPEVER